VVACLLIVLQNGKVQNGATFGTPRGAAHLARMAALGRLQAHVAMESTASIGTGYAILEVALQIVVANAHNVKKVPGRKTDVKDADGLPTCCATACFAPASFTQPSANCVT